MLKMQIPKIATNRWTNRRNRREESVSIVERKKQMK